MQLRQWVCKGDHNPIGFRSYHRFEVTPTDVIYTCRDCGARTVVSRERTVKRTTAEGKARRKYFASNAMGGTT